jgi:NAD(P)-dependent dehydrogenase (short-subunit alcohol dehydrogenase family)
MKRIALITGVLGGIGSAAAKAFYQSDWHIIGIDRRDNNESPWVSHFIKADLSESETPQHIVKEIIANEGRIDVLINNAAVQVCKSLIETSLEEWEITMSSNVRAAYLLIKSTYPFLKKSRGAIVNICSVHAFATSIGIAAYATSKGALLALTRAVALELAADGIRANAILPGAVDTDMLRSGLNRSLFNNQDQENRLSHFANKHPLGKLGKPEDIGKAILFLADNEQSSFITGQTLVIDGGALARLSTES